MAYDYHGSWDKKVLPNAPLRSGDGLSVVMHLEKLQRVTSIVDGTHNAIKFSDGDT